eukprot:5602370-Amphidinium_carterae.1
MHVYIRDSVATASAEEGSLMLLGVLAQGSIIRLWRRGITLAWLPGSESSALLPCGLPYDPLVRSSAPTSGRRRARWHRVRHRRQWINASIAYIDWLYLGKPAGDGLKWAAAVRSPLSKQQQQLLVGELERTYLAVCRSGEPTPVDPPGGGLSLLAKVLHLSSGLGYGADAVKKQSVLPVELSATNMSLPDVAGVVPLKAPVIPSVFEHIWETPDIFLRHDEDMPERLPPWFMCVHHWPRIAQQLLDRGLCKPVSPDLLTTWRGQHLRAGLFGVAKPQTEQRRVIIDRRRRNAVERCLRQVVLETALRDRWDPHQLEHAWRLLTLPRGAQLAELLCSPCSQVHCWSEDARDYFYLLRYDAVRHAETIVGFDVAASEFTPSQLEAWGSAGAWSASASLSSHPPWVTRRAWRWLNSVTNMSGSNMEVLHSRDGYHTNGPFPLTHDYGQIAVGADDLVTDDWADAEDFSTEGILREARARIQGVHKGYRESGLIRKETKARSEEKEMTLWGALVSGKNKTVRGSLEKMKMLIGLTTQLLAAATSSSDEVAALLGHWTFHCMFRRSCLCLLDHAYEWVRRDPSGSNKRCLRRECTLATPQSTAEQWSRVPACRRSWRLSFGPGGNKNGKKSSERIRVTRTFLTSQRQSGRSRI